MKIVMSLVVLAVSATAVILAVGGQHDGIALLLAVFAILLGIFFVRIGTETDTQKEAERAIAAYNAARKEEIDEIERKLQVIIKATEGRENDQ